MSKSLTFKAIETKFDGYRFRSRLEARWAVFFKTLGIEYHYEPEGYSIEGIAYLPDFYLPHINSFIEIKGQEPTTEEELKTHLLAVYTGKPVYTFPGNITFPREKGHRGFYCDTCPYLFRYSRTDHTVGYDFEDVYQDILVLLQKIDEASFTWEIFDDHFVLQQKPGSYWYPTAYDEYLLAMQHQANTAKDIFSLIQEHEEELVDLLAFDSDWITEFAPSEHFPGFRWCECSKCGHIALEHFILGSMYHEAETLHKKCLSTDKGNYHIDSPRLMEAYTAARQARFDGRGGI